MGKSTLALRYARDEWPQSDTFLLKTAQTPAEVEMVCSVLRHRARTLGLPTYLLLDNAGRQTELWPRVVQECAALEIPVLATLRQEDWYRFARTHRFSYETVEPSLSLDEAQQIYAVLHERGQIDASVESAAWAYEKIGTPPLLMEYVYLLTHGQMLEDRLRDQIAEISAHEHGGKLEILRRVALADALSAPVFTDRLCAGVADQPGFAGDARQLVRSLEEEYLKRHDDRLAGLHWVRSDHLVRLLHDDPGHLSDTALALLDAVPFEHLSDVVSNALCRADFDKERFMDGVINRARAAAAAGEVPILLALLEGVFEAGERQFLASNRAQFDHAYDFLGQSGPLLLQGECNPTLGKKFLSTFREASGTQNEGFDTLLAIGARLNWGARGRDQAQQLLSAASATLSSDALLANLGHTGDLLAWHGWCEIPCPAYDTDSEPLLQRASRLDFAVGELQRLAEGLWLYDRAGYRGWLDADAPGLNGYLRWQLDCLSLERDSAADPLEQGSGAQGELSIELFADDYDKAGKAAVDRLQVLYSLFPFYARYNSQGLWPLPVGVPLWHDPTTKHMTQEFQYLRFIVRRNQTWNHVVESQYALDSYYVYQREWHQLRRSCLALVNWLTLRLREVITGQMRDFTGAFPGDVLERTEQSLAKTPHPPAQTTDELKEALKPVDEWAGHWRPFRPMLLQTALYFTHQSRLAAEGEDVSEEEREARHRQHLTWHNFQEVCQHLPAMQASMRALFTATSDYFDAAALDAEEKSAYAEAAELLDVWLRHPLPSGLREREVEKYVKARRESHKRALMTRLRKALEPLEIEGMTFLYPQAMVEDFPLTMLPLGFSVSDPCIVEVERDRVLAALTGFAEEITFFWLIPLYEGARFLEGGFRASAHLPETDDEESWNLRLWTLGEQVIPEAIVQMLPSVPVRPSQRLKLRATLHVLVSHIAQFLQARQRLEKLRATGDFYDTKIYERHKARLLTEQTNLGLDFEEMRAILEAEFGTRRDEAGFACALALLEITEQLSSSTTWEELSQTTDFDPDNWHAAVNSLFTEEPSSLS